MNEFVVSVVMITYGHEHYIRQAIEGVLMQECNFKINLIIAEDHSPDNTAAVVKEIISSHPRGHWIEYTRHESNKGMMPNFVWALKQATGKYIAICEGDDYWTDPYKLQKQVDFLDENEDFVLCSHYREVLQNDTLTKEGQHTYTQCMLFRNILGPDFFEHLLHVFNGDTFLHNYLSLNGKIEIMEFCGAVYRVNDTGVYSSIDNAKRLKHGINTFNHLLQLKDNYRDDNARAVFKGIVAAQSTYYMSLIYLQTREKQRKEAFRSYIEYTKFGLRNGLIGRANFWKNNLRYFYYLVKH
ncbi:glycosyltransferase family 2 protein [Edaphocola aurantiacus]|uniref:glycosyltransferase family 2 protein n=1 Tax=Edaphocola aurantiacus TaxID=2601682 RepID=UPI001C98B948|nr:glycosyltransferase family 2 protein [Edaphocola aurantiacus]